MNLLTASELHKQYSIYARCVFTMKNTQFENENGAVISMERWHLGALNPLGHWHFPEGTP